VVLTPRRWRQVGGSMSARPGRDAPYPQATVTTSRSPGRARRKPLKPLRAGMPGETGATVVTTLVCFLLLHTRLRAHWAPGIPHALMGGRTMHNPGASRRGIVELCLERRHCEERLVRHKVRFSSNRLNLNVRRLLPVFPRKHPPACRKSVNRGSSSGHSSLVLAK
jgi:hypothetical protein